MSRCALVLVMLAAPSMARRRRTRPDAALSGKTVSGGVLDVAIALALRPRHRAP
jgi:hypothetical protein